MKNLTSNEIRKKFLEFFKNKEHEVLPSAPLVPENDSSVLFNTAGMQPLVPYLLGEKHPKGKRLVDAQKCVRTNDIEEVGDNTHHTFFEMLGNWSLNDYFKDDALNWSYSFLTDNEEGLGLDVSRIYATVFEGNDNAPRDSEAYSIWNKIFTEAGLNPEERIFFMDAENNWWSAGDDGPCGPDSEIFYDRTENRLGGLSKEKFIEADDRQDVVEIWNNVFMEYEKKDGKVIGKLANQNVDTGAGLERITAILQNKKSAYETDLFFGATEILEKESGKSYTDNKEEFRIILDHIRTSVFLISDGVTVSNKDQGYILRRILRRASIKMNDIGFENSRVNLVIDFFVQKYGQNYKNILEKKDFIKKEILSEIEKFEKTLEKGMKEFEKIINPKNKKNNIKQINFGEIDAEGLAQNEISIEDSFNLVTSYGFPKEILEEEAKKRGLYIDREGLDKKIKDHSEKSATASAGKFKGGMGGDSPKITVFHTATHLLLAGLQKFVSPDVHQAGSNITEERMRFDFTNDTKVERDVLNKVEDYVNGVIEKNAQMVVEEMDKAKAKESGVEGSFWEKYPDTVKVWTLKDSDGNIYSKELCGGPHIKNTSQISEFGKFKIKKESSSSSGVRRIKAFFEQ